MFINRYIGGKNIFAVKKLKIPYGKIYDYVKESNSKEHIINHKLNLLALKETKSSIHAIKLTSLYNPNLENDIRTYDLYNINNISKPTCKPLKKSNIV